MSHADETHHWVTPRLKRAHQTMMANLPKRYIADAWMLETTTAFATGEGSVAEDAMTYARSMAEGKTKDGRFFYMHRQASPDLDFTDPVQRRQGVIESRGEAAAWSNIDAICALFDDPTQDRMLLEQLYGNRPTAGGGRAFPMDRWAELARPENIIEPGELITLGFDGSRTQDATALIATHIATGFQWPIGIWERPAGLAPELATEWEVPEEEVNAMVAYAFETWQVYRMYADPPHWKEAIALWRGQYGEKVVIEWSTWNMRQMVEAIREFLTAIQSGTLTHNGDAVFSRHVANAVRRPTSIRDDLGNHLWSISKERDDSPFKIDACVAAIVSWLARLHAIAKGALNQEEDEGMSLYIPGEENL